MRKAPPAQLLLDGLSAPSAAAPKRPSAPAPKKDAARTKKETTQKRSNAEHAKHLLDCLDLVALQRRLQGERLAGIFEAVERHAATTGSLFDEDSSAHATTPGGRLSWRRMA